VKVIATPKSRKQPALADIHFRVTPAEFKQLQAYADKMDRSLSYLITKVVRDWMKSLSDPT
jgi:hypothetical protein